MHFFCVCVLGWGGGQHWIGSAVLSFLPHSLISNLGLEYKMGCKQGILLILKDERGSLKVHGAMKCFIDKNLHLKWSLEARKKRMKYGAS